MKYRGIYIEADNATFFTRIYNPDSEDTEGEKIVLVHGLGMSGTYMEPLAEELSQKYTVYVPDLPGFGRSSKPPHVLTVQEMADALFMWADVFPVKRAWYVGNSIGCQVIADFAVHYSQKIKGAVLQGPAIDPFKRNPAKQLLLFITLARYEPVSLIMMLLKEYISSGIKRVLKTFDYALHYNIEDLLPQVKVPVVVVWGENDKLVSRQWAEQFAELLPNGSLIKVLDEAHTLNYTAPRLLANIIAGFIGREKKQAVS